MMTACVKLEQVVVLILIGMIAVRSRQAPGRAL
jgi:hypothetical protein